MKLIIFAFLVGFTLANLLVIWFGAYGLWISSALLIPFDFVCRCIIHEKLKGSRLFLTLLGVTVAAAGITLLISSTGERVALASILGFSSAQLTAGVFYQWRKAKKDSYLIKVNASDLVAIVFDSIVFQWVAFSAISWNVTGGQILIKFIGGLVWYLIIFKLFKYETRINSK